MTQIIVAALYHFAKLPNYEELQVPLLAACEAAGTKGTLLLATEGINGTIAGSREGIDAVLAHIRSIPGLEATEHKESFAKEMPFLRMKVRLKNEIVTMGVPGTDPSNIVGTYVDPEDWNDLIAQDDVILIDTRNDYEVQIGTFKGAVNPKTTTFREFPEWFEKFQRTHNKPKVAMFCTGGIRCEKSTALAKDMGFEEVFHLKGGILKYLENVPEEKSTWEGECFVFDQRVSVKHGLELGSYDQCFACRRPITRADIDKPEFTKGVSCHQCYDEYSPEKKAAFEERQKQIELAKKRGKSHVGQDLTAERVAARLAAEEARLKSIAGKESAGE
ncbi:oxygen-dependent tRNA uridine(34) hydroxylase TrhO [Hirschia baltica]|uniref:tRNA uridine(34) hydroxylase n=1 Tax=Hirschia baltica (strain ATCC 49814 / DSM 5838 / IFAM 1418) TaxID=582402 RepID=C6XL85_HIRBI|nr:rhodanese-related sulfurtransferase [Hirschia baltica]ACT59684.1 Rhodanese domain protein [Hirschia baltica ATCC 49814]